MRLLMEGLSGSIAMNIRMLHRRRDLRDTRGTLPRHEAIVRAIRARDPEAARAAVEQHFAASNAVAQAMVAAGPRQV
jgi:GntR family transcriptional repressor for pyruvate dehydrogenase complex